MSDSTTRIATSYYQAMAEKDVAELTKYLHPDVHFRGLVEAQGREAFLGAAKHMMTLSTGLEIRAVVGDSERAMVAYDLLFAPPIGAVRTAALLTFDAGLIKSIELFFDASPFKR
jgi:SnoaL-like domain